MNPPVNDPRHPWSRLVTAARELRDERDSSAPYGFATRVAALALSQERRMASLFERFAFRAVGVASLLAVFSIVLNYEALSTTAGETIAQADEPVVTELVAGDDAVAVVLGIAD
jgi:hypothetical protein